MKTMTATSLKNLKPQAKAFEVADTSSPGLRIRINPTGKKTWFYRHKDPATGKMAKLTIGSFPAMSLADARAQWSELKNIRDRGLSPKSYRQHEVRQQQAEIDQSAEKSAQSSFTFNILVDIYIRHISDPAQGRQRGGFQKSWTDTQRNLVKHAAPVLGHMPAGDVTRYDVGDLLETLRTGHPVLPNRVAAAISSMYNFAITSPKLRDQAIVVNPAYRIQKTKEQSRERLLSDTEIRKLLTGKSSLTEIEKDMIELIWLTGCRRDEIAAMHWDEISGDVFLLPGDRSKNQQAHRIMLSGQAQAILEKHTGGGYIFKNDKSKGGHVRGDSLSKALSRALPSLKLKDVRLHDARHSLSTWLAENGYHLDMRDRLLNHSSGTGVDGVYNKAQLNQPAREAWQQWADYLQVLVSPNVKQLKPRKKKA